MTNRELITRIRKKVQEADADSSYYNSFLYNVAEDHSKWIIKREDSINKIFKAFQLFKPYPCVDIIETPKIDPCCNIITGCNRYRTKDKLPEMWFGSDGPIIKMITSIDGSNRFHIKSITAFELNNKNPYLKNDKKEYAVYNNGYVYLTKNPGKVDILAYWKEDISKYINCDNRPIVSKDKCLGFLDQEFLAPDWTHAEIINKSVEEILNYPKRIPVDEKINKNEQR